MDRAIDFSTGAQRIFYMNCTLGPYTVNVDRETRAAGYALLIPVGESETRGFS